MRPEQIIIALIVFVIVILATTTLIQENVTNYKISNASLVMLQEASVNISEFTELSQEQKNEEYGDTSTTDTDTKETDSIWVGVTSIKKAQRILKSNQKVTNTIAKRSGIKGISIYLNLGMLILIILFIFFLAYYFRGFQPSKRD